MNHSKNAKQIATKSVSIASVHMNYEAADSVWQCIAKEAFKQVTAHGPRVLEMPRSAAVAHEVGHVIVNAHHGRRVSRVRVFEHEPGVWGGFTHTKGGWMDLSATGSPDDILQYICNLSAGFIGEAILDPTGVRTCSSLDEVVVSQLIADQLASRWGNVSPEVLWRKCQKRTAFIIKFNEEPARALMAKLSLCGTVRGTPLAKIMATVRKLPDEDFMRGIAP